MNPIRSTPNIAFIKYWGNRHDEYRLPMAGSTSMTLDGPYVDVSVEYAEEFTLESYNEDGSQKELKEKDIDRIRNHNKLCQEYLGTLGKPYALSGDLHVKIESRIPPSIGLASSAAVFSAIAKAYAELIKEQIVLDNTQISILARLGSGSAARSIFGGFGAIEVGQGNEIGSSHGFQIAEKDHWKLYDIILVPSTDEKKVGSTEGHASAHTSPHFSTRIDAIKQCRMQECVDAIEQKDFEKLQRVAEEDCMDMHHVMQTQNTALNYLSDETHRIIGEVQEIRSTNHLPVLYTMDAGPTVHLFCEEEALATIRAYAKEQTGCQMFEAKAGHGAHVLEN